MPSGQKLQASHNMPRSLYKKARGAGKTGNQDPTVVTLDGRWQSSFQPKDYVLCRECEALFSKRGEHYAMRLVCQQDGAFPLLEMLRRAPSRVPVQLGLKTLKTERKGRSLWSARTRSHRPAVVIDSAPKKSDRTKRSSE
jgi:hypothetical protein